VAEFLREGGARPWQVAVAAPFLLAIEGVSEPLIMEYPDEGVSELS
jgi:hypothetical protein